VNESHLKKPVNSFASRFLMRLTDFSRFNRRKLEMHEFSICQQMIRQVKDIARQNQAASVEQIKLQIGPLSGVDVSLLKHAFPFAAKQTIAENSQLLIEELPVIIQCNQCGLKTHTQVNRLVCGQCGILYKYE